LTLFFIRTASVRDIDRVRPVLVDTWHNTYDDIYSAEIVNDICETWHSVDTIKANIDERNAEYVVADSGEAIGGMAYVKGPKSDVGSEGIAYLSQLYVLPEFQGQGIGCDLMDEVEASFPEAKLMRLGVDARNVKAVGFYEHFGYKNTGIRLEEGGMEALVFEKALL
jgi:ribosomal protein S18 acetylase RimI-like enzyme